MGHTYTENELIIYLKSKFNWVSCILSDNLNTSETIKFGNEVCIFKLNI